MKDRISANAIRRLPRYLRRLVQLEKQQVEKISSNDLGKRMGLTASQIRQDFNCFGGFGQQGYGYNVCQLKKGIAEVLGVEDILTAVVIGAGNLGRAIAASFRFDECGFVLSAAFDIAPELIGTDIAGTPVLNAAELERYLAGNRVDVAVLTLPKESAADTAKLAARAGVRGIWNFTGVDLNEGLEGVVVENVHFSDSLLNLGYYLRHRDG